MGRGIEWGRNTRVEPEYTREWNRRYKKRVAIG